MLKKETDGAARSQALAWYVERLDGDLSPDDEAAFNAWLAGDPAHRREYGQLDVLCEQLGAFEAAPQVEQAKAYAARYRAHAAQKRRFAGLVSAPMMGMAAASLIAVVGVWLFMGQGLVSSGQGSHMTALGEQQTIDLADGSIVRLNTLSSVEITYSDEERRVLLHNGQASFDVAPDKARPFVVEAGDGVVTAVGTSFDVYRAGDDVTVTLIEGIVEVRNRDGVALPSPSPPSSPAAIAPPATALQSAAEASTHVTDVSGILPAVAELRPGEQISIGRGGALTAVAQVDVERIVAWRDGNIDLHDTPLRQAIAEVNRYSEVKLVLADDDLAGVEVSGLFKIGKPKNFIRALETRFGLRAVQTSDGRILLQPPAAG